MYVLLPRVRRRTSLLLAAGLLPSLIPSLAAPAPGHVPRAATTVVAGRVTDPGGRPISAASVTIAERSLGTITDGDGRYALRVARQGEIERVVVTFRRIGFVRRDLPVAVRGDTVLLDAQLAPPANMMEQLVITTAPGSTDGAAREESRPRPEQDHTMTRVPVTKQGPGAASIMLRGTTAASPGAVWPRRRRYPIHGDSGNTEAYEHIDENAFRSPRVAPLSTFSVDVDRASYSNVRRFLTGGSLPPRDAVRIEELVNYFPYADPAPDGRDPLRITTEVAPAPWNPSHDLVRIGLRARDVDMRRAPPSNLVFLIDVSGSMMGPNRLPLVKQSLALLVDELREQDRVAIVVYAGRAGLVLPSTSGADKPRIRAALEGLQAGGSTAGGAGIKLAYDVALQNFIRGGTNRVILCTDGDFNVGQSSDAALVQLIEEKRREGSFLTILGFGMGNYKDQKMEKLAGAGNGNYAYIDDLLEASKMLVKEMGGTLLTVAKDVKLQVEFDPTRVQAYRLLGYEDRLLGDEDFANDVKDAGDVGAGHAVTALYEIVRADERLDVALPGVAPLRYQRLPTLQGRGDELLHVALRYKQPAGERSVLLTQPVRWTRRGRAEPSESMRFASAVAGFGMLLRNSPNAGSLTWPQVVSLARGAKGDDPDGYRADFIRLAEIASELNRREVAVERWDGRRRDDPGWPGFRTDGKTGGTSISLRCACSVIPPPVCPSSRASFSMADYPHLRIDSTPAGVRTITLDRPDKLNAVNGALASSLSAALAEAGRDDAVRVLVITGAGRAFCAGLDLSAPPELPTATRAERLDPYAWVGSWVRGVVACEKPVIAAVNGPAAGAGFGLALACDVRIVAASAKMTAGYVRRGLSPDAGVSYFLPRHVGLGRASDILLTGRDVDAAEADRIGLATLVVPDAELASASVSYATRLASGAPIAHALTKRLLAETFDRALDAALRDELTHIKHCFTTTDVAEAMNAFREKRPPSFTGR